MYKIVIEPVAFLRGLLNPHSICGELLSTYAHRYRAIFSERTIIVLQLLLFYPYLSSQYPGLRQIKPQDLTLLFARAARVKIETPLDTNMFVSAAIAAKADYIVCEDPVMFKARDRIPVPIIDARAFITLLEVAPSPAPSDIVNPGKPTEPRPSTLP